MISGCHAAGGWKHRQEAETPHVLGQPPIPALASRAPSRAAYLLRRRHTELGLR